MNREPKLCVNCEYFGENFLTFWQQLFMAEFHQLNCYHPSGRRTETNAEVDRISALVDGTTSKPTISYTSARIQRGFEGPGYCGAKGLYYEPIDS